MARERSAPQKVTTICHSFSNDTQTLYIPVMYVDRIIDSSNARFGYCAKLMARLLFVGETLMNQREAFENWHKGMYGPVRSRRDGNYLEPEQGRWLAWSTSRSVVVEEVERVVTPAIKEAISSSNCSGGKGTAWT